MSKVREKSVLRCMRDAMRQFLKFRGRFSTLIYIYMFCIFIRNNFLNFQIYFNIWDRQMVFNILNMNLLIKNSNLIITNLNHTSLAWLRMIMDPLPVFNSIVFAFNSILYHQHFLFYVGFFIFKLVKI